MSFGFGIGDFVALSSLTLKLYKAFKNAPEEFSEMSRELHSFHIIVADLMDQAGDADSSLNKHATARKLELIALCDNLVATMEELGDLHQRYQRMGRIGWSRFSLGQQDLAAMRSKLTLQISAVNTFVGSLNMAALGRMKPMLEKIFRLLDERAKGAVDVAQTVLSVKMEDDDDGASWAMLEMDLRTEGIPQQYIQQKKGRIMEVVCSVVELNHLDGIDGGTIYADDSLSQIGWRPSQKPEVNQSPGKWKPKPVGVKSSALKLAVTKPKASKPQIAPYRDWAKTLSKEQEGARIKLMNYGFDLRNFNIQSPKPSRLSIFRSLTPPAPIQENGVCWAVKNGELVALEMLLERGCSPSSKQDGIGAVIHAAEAERWDIVTILVKSGADIQAGNIINGPKSNLLSMAAASKFDVLNSRARGLIQMAAMKNRIEVLALILEMGIDVDTVVTLSKRHPFDLSLPRNEEFSWTALHWAVKTGSLEATQFLLLKGANIDQRTWSGETTLHLAISYHAGISQKQGDNEDLIAEPRSRYIIRILLENGANVNGTAHLGQTPLHLAIFTHSADLYELLLDAGADANAPDPKGYTPLMRAVRVGDVELAKHILNAGGSVNVKATGTGRTPLHTAVYPSGHKDMVELLLEHGAEVNARDDLRTTPLQLAVSQDLAVNYSMYMITKLLIDRGADITPFLESNDEILKSLFLDGKPLYGGTN